MELLLDGGLLAVVRREFGIKIGVGDAALQRPAIVQLIADFQAEADGQMVFGL